MLRPLLILAAIATAGLAAPPTARDWLKALDLLPDMEKLNSALSEPPQKPILKDASNLTCPQAIDQLYVDLFNGKFGAIYYLLVNGWYLGAWGDFDSCVNGDTTYGQYILVTINGIYN